MVGKKQRQYLKDVKRQYLQFFNNDGSLVAERSAEFLIIMKYEKVYGTSRVPFIKRFIENAELKIKIGAAKQSE